MYRWISISSIKNSSITLNGKIVERFGAINSFLFPLESHCDLSTDWAEDIRFSCFQDVNLGLYKATKTECEYLLDIENIERISNIVYPSITDGIIYINVDNFVSLKIYSIDGQELYKSNKITKQLDISKYNDGLYICFIEDISNKLRVQKIIKK
jgi:hypothetical protein